MLSLTVALLPVPVSGTEALWRADLSAVTSGKLSWNAWLCIVQPAAAQNLCGTELVSFSMENFFL